MADRYGASYRNGGDNGYGSYGRRAQRPPPLEQEEEYDPFGGDGAANDRYGAAPQQMGARRPPPRNGGYGGPGLASNSYGNASASRLQRAQESSAERRIAEVLERVKEDWPALCEPDCIPASLALQLLDNSSVGRAHEYPNFQEMHQYLQDSLKGIVHEHHQGFNSSIGTFHKIQGSIQASQKRVRTLKDSLVGSRATLGTTDPELKKMYKTSQQYDEVLQTLNELEDLRQVPDQLEARISEKRFLTAVEVLQNALRKLRKPELDNIGALSELRGYLANQETALMDILVEELHEHLYLKSPYCQERWQSLSKNHGAFNSGNYGDQDVITPFHYVLDSMELESQLAEDPAKNPEADTFWYVQLLVESLNKLGRLEGAVDTLKQRLPVELFSVVNETINEVDQRHPSSLRGGASNAEGLHIYGSRETQMRADVIYDLLWTLYGKFEAIAEGHRVFHETIKALIKREGSGNNSSLLGSFKELWNLYQNEIRSLLHNYVTTDADVYHFNSSPKLGGSLNGSKNAGRDNLFKFSEADPKSIEMTTEYDALDGIIQAAVPGLTSDPRKTKDSEKKGRDQRKSANTGAFENRQGPGSYKSLVEPSVFNMSLLLPPTLVFLQRLKVIVPPGSDLAASTLTSFLDNFLVNVFQPQLDETLAKLSDNIFAEIDTFQEDPDWSNLSRRPIFRGTTQFFTVVTAFCQMLDTIPHDQALSSLIISQMNRYYERCFAWFKSLVAKAQEVSSAAQELRFSAQLSTTDGELQETAKKLWELGPPDRELVEKEVGLLITQTGERTLEPSDIVQDRDVISSLCLLYTSMKWLNVKIGGLRYITHQDTDSSRPVLPRHQSRRWTLLNDPKKAGGDRSGPVYLPMTQETVQSFDSIVNSYDDLAGTVLLTLHLEVRCRTVYSLAATLSPVSAPYVLPLDQEIKEPDQTILSLNSELVAYDETTVRFLREREISFIRTGVGLLINSYLVGKALQTQPMNASGCSRMKLNILVLQQNLKNIEGGIDLARAANYYSLFEAGPDGIIEKAKADKERGPDAIPAEEKFSYDELKAMVELCYSEQLANPERGIAAAAKRQMGEKNLALSEYAWQN